MSISELVKKEQWMLSIEAKKLFSNESFSQIFYRYNREKLPFLFLF
jgi:hypothetical protein